MKRPVHQQGFTLVAVIFLIIVIGGALTLLATLSSQSSHQITQNLLHSQARYAALAGLEWGKQQLVSTSNPSTLCGSTSLNTLVKVPAYANIRVTLSCLARPYASTGLFELTAAAEYGRLGDADYVWTQQEVTLGFN